MGILKRVCLRAASFLLLGAAVILLLLNPATALPAGLDPESVRCINCHESLVDPDAPGLVCHSAGCNHPVGLDYTALAARNPGYAPPAKLDPKMRFTGGILGCTTCHVPYSEDDHKILADKRAKMGPLMPDPMLAIDNPGSKLCLECHRK